MHGLRHSRTGRVLRALPANQRAASGYGVSVVRAKLTAFAVSGFVAGLAGCLFLVVNQQYEETAVPGAGQPASCSPRPPWAAWARPSARCSAPRSSRAAPSSSRRAGSSSPRPRRARRAHRLPPRPGRPVLRPARLGRRRARPARRHAAATGRGAARSTRCWCREPALGQGARRRASPCSRSACSSRSSCSTRPPRAPSTCSRRTSATPSTSPTPASCSSSPSPVRPRCLHPPRRRAGRPDQPGAHRARSARWSAPPSPSGSARPRRWWWRHHAGRASPWGRP